MDRAMDAPSVRMARMHESVTWLDIYPRIRHWTTHALDLSCRASAVQSNLLGAASGEKPWGVRWLGLGVERRP